MMVTVMSIDGGTDFQLAPSLARSNLEARFGDYFFSLQNLGGYLSNLHQVLQRKMPLKNLHLPYLHLLLQFTVFPIPAVFAFTR